MTVARKLVAASRPSSTDFRCSRTKACGGVPPPFPASNLRNGQGREHQVDPAQEGPDCLDRLPQDRNPAAQEREPGQGPQGPDEARWRELEDGAREPQPRVGLIRPFRTLYTCDTHTAAWTRPPVGRARTISYHNL